MTARDEGRARSIQAALDDFRDTLAHLPVVGAGYPADLDRLAELISRHPGEARKILDSLEDQG